MIRWTAALLMSLITGTIPYHAVADSVASNPFIEVAFEDINKKIPPL